jgi:cytochrome c556
MLVKRSILFGVAAAVAAGSIAIAAGHGGNPAVTARKAHMQLYAHNLGVLGGMAKGEIPYAADQAQAAADNLAVLAMMNQMSYWPAGTSTDDLGTETRSLPAAWEPGNRDDLMAKSAAMAEAASAMQAAAGTLEGVQASIGAIGGACGACHKAYRQPSS